MSAALVILPMVWATSTASAERGDGVSVRKPMASVKSVAAVAMDPAAVVEQPRRTAPEVAFYRKYTEGLLRRYVRMSLEAGRAPSLLGREMFRGNVTNYSVTGFDDVVIFVHDVEQCVKMLSEEQQLLVRRIALQAYYAMMNGAVESFGGGVVSAPMRVVFELQDLGAASNTPAMVLYDGGAVSSPASCSFVSVNSVQLFGSMGYCRITQTGSAWVVSTLPNGTKMTRLIGVAGEGVDCKVSAAGKVTFFSGRVPIAGELVTVLYRTKQRAVARLKNAASVAAEAAGGLPGTAQWLGKVLKPVARSSMDCESAALAVLSSSANRATAVSGTYEAVNPSDVWPGDVLALTSGGQTASVIVRRVEIVDGMTCPEGMTYKIAFANDWAEGLGLSLSEAIAADALLPETALTAPGNVLANLQELQVVSATSSALQVDAGTVPPPGGGFEVRRRDGDFGPGVDQDLVLRSPVRGFSIPREAQVEHYYVRMYDGSAPPLYSRFSSAVFTDLPVS